MIKFNKGVVIRSTVFKIVGGCDLHITYLTARTCLHFSSFIAFQNVNYGVASYFRYQIVINQANK
jgi:hypothetical protein